MEIYKPWKEKLKKVGIHFHFPPEKKKSSAMLALVFMIPIW